MRPRPGLLPTRGAWPDPCNGAEDRKRAPTVFVNVANTSQLAREEVFGPVVAVMPFEDEDEAVALANDTDYGLVGGLWTSDVTRAHRVAHQIEAGLVSVNTFRPVHWMLPYGGY
jgi:(Z)-2-((N-methylformamido)methylene)-5-hydroxybutyrolactone dehydrogenase